MTGRDAGYGLTPSCHHVLVASVDKHPVVNIDMSHSHLSWGQNVRSCLTESLKTHFKLVSVETVQFYVPEGYPPWHSCYWACSGSEGGAGWGQLLRLKEDLEE